MHHDNMRNTYIGYWKNDVLSDSRRSHCANLSGVHLSVSYQRVTAITDLWKMEVRKAQSPGRGAGTFVARRDSYGTISFQQGW